MHTFSLHLDSRFQNLPLLSNELCDRTLKGWSLFQIKEKKDAFVHLSGDLQLVQFRYPATQLLYPSCFCFASLSLTLVFITCLTLLKLEVCLILVSFPGWDDVLLQNPSTNPTELFAHAEISQRENHGRDSGLNSCSPRPSTNPTTALPL